MSLSSKIRRSGHAGPHSFMATVSWVCTVTAPSKSISSISLTAWFNRRFPFSHLSCLPGAWGIHVCHQWAWSSSIKSLGVLCSLCLVSCWEGMLVSMMIVDLLISLKFWCLSFIAVLQRAQKLSSLVAVMNLSLINMKILSLFHCLYAFRCSYHHLPHICFIPLFLPLVL